MQQLNYVLFAIVIVHAILYQIIEKRSPPFAFAIGFLAANGDRATNFESRLPR